MVPTDQSKARILVLAVLSVQSSYRKNTEQPAGKVPDTVQWWLTPNNAWRIKTFALDHDIHIYEIGTPIDPEKAISNTKKSYGDVIRSLNVLQFPDYTAEQIVRETLQRAGLTPNLEIAAGDFAFWNPDGARYRTQSRPRQS